MKKIISLLLILTLLLTGCGVNLQGTYSEHVYTDEETGVNYIIVMAGVGNTVSVTVTPRYNADGSLYINKEH